MLVLEIWISIYKLINNFQDWIQSTKKSFLRTSISESDFTLNSDFVQVVEG